MTELDIKSKILKFSNKTLLNSEGKRCRFVDHSFYKNTKEVQLRVSFGFGASEKIETYLFPLHDLDLKLDSYSIAPKLENINTEVKPIKHTLQMSEHNDNNMKGLRNHLFQAIRKLEGGTMKEGEAKAMASVAQVIINSAKLEMEFKLLTDKTPKINLIED